MEIISIEKKTFEEMVSRFDELVTRAGALYPKDNDKKMSEWMDSQDVCMLLNISPRTLQTLRDNGRLAYSQINHKTYYLPEDVERVLAVVEKKKESMTIKEQNAYG
ncbi:helix-turn-helix domain-containing protein [Phocaeicola dorei]|jgi:hypothetical protein|uniref:helix-turn-helix domain-containing protein n=1 Tax=Phocaeicola dorei TaxID=357276 RepID=UPI0032BFB265|nr:helix-turn-helix domain-containing protein [Bacteroides fragilis]